MNKHIKRIHKGPNDEDFKDDISTVDVKIRCANEQQGHMKTEPMSVQASSVSDCPDTTEMTIIDSIVTENKLKQETSPAGCMEFRVHYHGGQKITHSSNIDIRYVNYDKKKGVKFHKCMFCLSVYYHANGLGSHYRHEHKVLSIECLMCERDLSPSTFHTHRCRMTAQNQEPRKKDTIAKHTKLESTDRGALSTKKCSQCEHYFITDMFKMDDRLNNTTTVCAACLKMGNPPPFKSQSEIKSKKQSYPWEDNRHKKAKICRVRRIDSTKGKPKDIGQCPTCNSWFTLEKITEHIEKCDGGDHAAWCLSLSQNL